jgi:hypothetical protein
MRRTIIRWLPGVWPGMLEDIRNRRDIRVIE